MEDDEEQQETIDTKYLIQEKKGHGKTSDVYLVKMANSDKIYAAKVFKENSKYFDKEVDILNYLKPINNPYMINIIDARIGLIKRKGHPETKKQILILEYASKGELFDYIYYPSKGLSERHAKVIFLKILKGVQSFHEAGICNRDIKSQNILVDENFNPKICDFGFADFNSTNLKEFLGTEKYAAPEMFYKKPYDGIKADIFSLGVLLLTLTTCKFGFYKAIPLDPYYNLIFEKHYLSYWKKLGSFTNDMSEDLKNLYLSMVSFKPKNRPSIDEILNSDWMKEIREMNKEQMEELENEVRNEFLEREYCIKEGLK